MQISLPFLQRSNSDSKRWIVDLSLVFLSFSFSNLRFHSSAVSSSLTTTVFLIVLALKKSHNHKFSIVSICTANKLGKNDCIFNRFSPKTYRTVTKFPLSLSAQQASLAKTTKTDGDKKLHKLSRKMQSIDKIFIFNNALLDLLFRVWWIMHWRAKFKHKNSWLNI